jgi:hypothetical protein
MNLQRGLWRSWAVFSAIWFCPLAVLAAANWYYAETTTVPYYAALDRDRAELFSALAVAGAAVFFLFVVVPLWIVPVFKAAKKRLRSARGWTLTPVEKTEKEQINEAYIFGYEYGLSVRDGYPNAAATPEDVTRWYLDSTNAVRQACLDGQADAIAGHRRGYYDLLRFAQYHRLDVRAGRPDRHYRLVLLAYRWRNWLCARLREFGRFLLSLLALSPLGLAIAEWFDPGLTRSLGLRWFMIAGIALWAGLVAFNVLWFLARWSARLAGIIGRELAKEFRKGWGGP